MQKVTQTPETGQNAPNPTDAIFSTDGDNLPVGLADQV
jgi:hypothetical protein